ncbi:MAG: 2-phospho-L-lactate transferase [Candidatus Dormiibacterota bacterium]
MSDLRLTVLAGGVGAARFIAGLVAAAPQAEITVVGNTGDDFLVHGLHVSPDLDTVAYTLSGRADEVRGWGLAGETWATLSRLRELGAETWFQLGDLDLATHLRRTALLQAGWPLSAVTAELCQRLSVPARLIPMSDQPVTTRVHLEDGRDLHLQEYLVREEAAPPIRSVEFQGVEEASPGPGVLEAISGADLVLIAPSNPVISIGPILAVPGVRPAVVAARRVAAVSPIVAGRAIKGPAVAMMLAEGLPASALGVALAYRELIDLMVIDRADSGLAAEISALGLRVHSCPTLMTDQRARRRLAAEVLRAAGVTPAAGGRG